MKTLILTEEMIFPLDFDQLTIQKFDCKMVNYQISDDVSDFVWEECRDIIHREITIEIIGEIAESFS